MPGWNWQKKIKQMLSKTLRLNFCYLKIIHILRSSDHAKIIGLIQKSNQKNKRVCIHESIQISIIKMKIKMKSRLHRYGINRPRSRHWRSIDEKVKKNDAYRKMSNSKTNTNNW